MVERPSQIVSSGWEAHPKGLEFSEGRNRRSGVVGWPSRNAGSVQEALLEGRNGRETHREDRERSGGPAGEPRMVERPYWMVGRPYWIARCPPGGLGVVGRPYQRVGRGQDAL